MPVYRLGEDLAFPPPQAAEPSGLLAVGGDLTPERLLLAYTLGIFPWYDEEQPILWHSPDPRLVLLPRDLCVSRNLRRVLRRGGFEIRLDTAFPEVIRACAEAPRKNAPGTWITDEMTAAYCRLFDLGFAHSAEAWQDGELVGGLYGVSLGGCFFGESMFTRRTDASKAAFVTLVRQLDAWGFDLIDCQITTGHLQRLGAREIPRELYLEDLQRCPVEEWGSAIEGAGLFERGTNVEFVQILGEQRLLQRTWERGAKETLSCGSGAAAAAVVAVAFGWAKSPVEVRLTGGTLNLRWDGKGPVYLSGDAVEVFTGEVEV